MPLASASELCLTLLAPERKGVRDELVKFITLPGMEGELQILPGHAEIVGALGTGIFRYERREVHGSTAPAQLVTGVVTSGFFYVQGEQVQVLAQTLEFAHEIDLARAQTAQVRAERQLQSPHLSDENFRKYQLKLRRAIIRQAGFQIAGR